MARVARVTRAVPSAHEREGAGAAAMALSTRRHFHQLWIELTEHGHQIILGRHDFADVFVGHRNFVETGADERDSAFAKQAIHVFPVEFLVRGFAAHRAARAMRCGV